MEEVHLASLGDLSESDSDASDSLEIHSSDEVASSVDETQNKLVRLSTCLNIESEHENDDNENYQWLPQRQSSSSPSTSDVEELTGLDQVPLHTESSINSTEQRKSTKRKRRQWTVKEKLDAIFSVEESKNKRQTAKKERCTTAQLRNRIKNKDDLLSIYRKKKGSKRERLEGGEKKLVFVDLDQALLLWYRSRRTDPRDTFLAPCDIRRENVTLRQLEKERCRIAKDLKQRPSSSS